MMPPLEVQAAVMRLRARTALVTLTLAKVLRPRPGSVVACRRTSPGPQYNGRGYRGKAAWARADTLEAQMIANLPTANRRPR